VAFAHELAESLQDRAARVPEEISNGQSLEEVLGSHLLTVESTADTVLLTSILLLDHDGRRLWHAAAPSLPQSYCMAINGSEIGPTAGSCGTAAFKDQAIYVTDIATDPLWSDYRHLALPHGLRACWSTPIHDDHGLLLGTFAIYHLTPRSPTQAEVDAIGMITRHVAGAICSYREVQDLARPAPDSVVPRGSTGPDDDIARTELVRTLISLEEDLGKIATAIEQTIEAFPNADLDGLIRARRAAARGQILARMIRERD
jgi:hypothetical protein